MPELPDLTIYRRNLEKHLLNKTVTGGAVQRPKRLNVTPLGLIDALTGATLKSIARSGKELFFKFSNGHTLSVHLMLKGRFDIVPNESDIKFKSATIGFGDAGCLVMSDPRGWLKLQLDPEMPVVPDALSPEFDLDYLRSRLEGSDIATLKEFLTDQTIVRGIGNAYVDEILWDCRISPFSVCKKIPMDAVELLWKSIHDVLCAGIESIAESAPDAINGEHRDFLQIHIPNKEFAPSGAPIRTADLASRLTYFTDEQALYK